MLEITSDWPAVLPMATESWPRPDSDEQVGAPHRLAATGIVPADAELVAAMDQVREVKWWPASSSLRKTRSCGWAALPG